MLWFGITSATVCFVLLGMLFIQHKRFSVLLNEQEAELDKLRTLASKSTAAITRITQEKETLQASEAKLTEEKFHMAEANLDLLAMQEKFAEKTGILEADKFKLAEANIKLMEITEDLQREQEKSNRLLRNILPERVIKDFLGEISFTHYSCDSNHFALFRRYINEQISKNLTLEGSQQ